MTLAFFLFKGPWKKVKTLEKIREFSFLTGLFFLIPGLALGLLFFEEKWLRNIIILLIVNFGMDTGGWAFGKLFGKHKLMPEVSPNKTVEGLLGGILTSAVLGSLFWYFFGDGFDWTLFVLFAFLGLISQVGDLFQSKVKRTFGVKDSSNLIPGNGGIYDRLDGLIYLAPFFAVALNYIIHVR